MRCFFLSTLETESAIRWEKRPWVFVARIPGPDKTRSFAADMGVSENVVYPYINPMVLLIMKSRF